jgi:hypothetical protein
MNSGNLLNRKPGTETRQPSQDALWFVAEIGNEKS